MIRMLDSFDHYATADILGKYTQWYNAGTGSVTPTIGAYGRRSSNGIRFQNVGSTTSVSGTLSRVIPTTNPTFIAGYAIKASGDLSWGNLASPIFNTCLLPTKALGTAFNVNPPCSVLIACRYGGLTQCALIPYPDGTLAVVRGNANYDLGVPHLPDSIQETLGQSTKGLLANTTYYIELKVVLDFTAGSVEVRVNGDTWISATGISTVAGGPDQTIIMPAQWSEVTYGQIRGGLPGKSIYWDVDDYYVADADTSDPTNTTIDFLGDVEIDYDVPVNDVQKNWTPLTGTQNFAMVDEIPPDGDLSYNSTSTPGAVDTFGTNGTPIVGADVVAVQVIYDRRRTQGGNTSTEPVWDVGGVNYTKNPEGDPSTYAFNWGIWTVDPSTLGAITAATFNASSVGYEKVT